MRGFRVYFGVLFTFLLAACNREVIQVVFTQTTNCQYPCWSNYRPLESDEKDVYQGLDNNDQIREFDNAYPLNDKVAVILARTKWPSKEIEVRLVDGLVQSTYVDVDSTPLGKVISEIGSPDKVGIGRTNAGDYYLFHYYLVYDMKGIILHVILTGNAKEITESSDVAGVIFTDNSVFEDVLEYYNTSLPITFYPWLGFRAYEQ